DLGMQQRLPARDRHHRGARLLDRSDRVLDADPLTQDLGRVLDLSAPGALEVAREQRLELDDERESLAPRELLAREVPTHAHLLTDGNRHLTNLRGECKVDRLVDDLTFAHGDRSEGSERVDHTTHERLGRRSARGDADGRRVAQPRELDLRRVLDELRRAPLTLRDLDETFGFRRVARAHDEVQVALPRELAHRLLAVLCRVAYVVGARADLRRVALALAV